MKRNSNALWKIRTKETMKENHTKAGMKPGKQMANLKDTYPASEAIDDIIWLPARVG